MRVGVVGAGIAGLAAARRLTAAGHNVVVWDKGRGVGGRVATRRIGDFAFDSGATSIAPRGRALEQVMLRELPTDDLVRLEREIHVLQALRVVPGNPDRNRVPRYAYRNGNTRLPKLLAEGLDVRLDVQIETLEREDRGWRVLNERFDGLILTLPLPQASVLLWSIGEERPIAASRYRPCLSVLLGFDRDLPPTPYHALIEPEQRHPLTWLSLESLKAPGRAPEGGTAMVAQMSPGYSLDHWDRPDERVVADVLGYLERLYGSGWDSPVVASVKRWKYSQPEALCAFDTINPSDTRLILAGDGVGGPRVELAYEAGVQAADRVLQWTA